MLSVEYAPLSPFFHTSFDADLEKLLTIEEPLLKPSVLDRFISDKASSLRSRARRIHAEIKTRQELNLLLMNDIERKASEITSNIMQLEILESNYNPELRRETDTLKMHFRNQIFELEKEKRREYLECWKDLLFLKKELLPVLEEFLSLLGKRRVLTKDYSILHND